MEPSVEEKNQFIEAAEKWVKTAEKDDLFGSPEWKELVEIIILYADNHNISYLKANEIWMSFIYECYKKKRLRVVETSE